MSSTSTQSMFSSGALSIAPTIAGISRAPPNPFSAPASDWVHSLHAAGVDRSDSPLATNKLESQTTFKLGLNLVYKKQSIATDQQARACRTQEKKAWPEYTPEASAAVGRRCGCGVTPSYSMPTVPMPDDAPTLHALRAGGRAARLDLSTKPVPVRKPTPPIGHVRPRPAYTCGDNSKINIATQFENYFLLSR
jgi:hypothetical protein